ncbi:MAG: hypothetical protein J3R72DRAFT_140340 [Linnemannia gamsii]|nr:MAG: hypothetical protein J3R72DRAFT_140340 [Linnemannia gamsii]
MFTFLPCPSSLLFSLPLTYSSVYHAGCVRLAGREMKETPYMGIIKPEKGRQSTDKQSPFTFCYWGKWTSLGTCKHETTFSVSPKENSHKDDFSHGRTSSSFLVFNQHYRLYIQKQK